MNNRRRIQKVAHLVHDGLGDAVGSLEKQTAGAIEAVGQRLGLTKRRRFEKLGVAASVLGVAALAGLVVYARKTYLG